MEENRVEQIKAKDIIQKRYFLVSIKEETCKKENYQKTEWITKERNDHN